MNPSDNKTHPYNPLEVMSPGEQVICEIRRHPIGMLGVYFGSAFLIVLLIAGAVAIPTYVQGLSQAMISGLYLVALLIGVLALLFTYIASVVYNGNRWVVTSDSITQMTQTGLFTKQTSQLSLANLEDVTFEQNSLIQQLFGFGLLKVETAGERAKFSFPFCPRPDHCAREIIQAHENFIQAHPEEGQGLAQRPGTYDPEYAKYQQWLQSQKQAGENQATGASGLPPSPVGGDPVGPTVDSGDDSDHPVITS